MNQRRNDQKESRTERLFVNIVVHLILNLIIYLLGLVLTWGELNPADWYVGVKLVLGALFVYVNATASIQLNGGQQT